MTHMDRDEALRWVEEIAKGTDSARFVPGVPIHIPMQAIAQLLLEVTEQEGSDGSDGD